MQRPVAHLPAAAAGDVKQPVKSAELRERQIDRQRRGF